MCAVAKKAFDNQSQTDRSMSEFRLGEVCGTIALPADCLADAADLAAKYFAECEAAEFCGDPVEDLDFPPSFKDRAWRNNLIPHDALRAMGLVAGAREWLLATVSADKHVDTEGLTLGICLFNDGLTFIQGRERHKTAPGQWFVFDDTKAHEVRESRTSTSYVIWTLPLHGTF